MDVEQLSLVVIQSSLYLLLTVSKDLIGTLNFSILDLDFLKSSSSYSQLNGKKVACGAWTLDAVDTNEEALEVTEIINHPEYNPSTFENDVAILKVSGSFTCEQGKIWPACLPNEDVSLVLLKSKQTLKSLSRIMNMLDGRTPLHLVGEQHPQVEVFPQFFNM